jgi:hypothetical protein
MLAQFTNFGMYKIGMMKYHLEYRSITDIDKIRRTNSTGIRFRHQEIGIEMNQDWSWNIWHGSRTEIRTTGDGTVNQEYARSIAW